MWHELQEEIEVELEELKRLFEPFESLLEKVKTKAPDAVETVALAGLLHSFYTGVENIFKRIAINLDKGLPHGESWHRQLLDFMCQKSENRPAVISESLRDRLDMYMHFRHVFRHAYSFYLQWNKMEPLVLECKNTLKLCQTELELFLKKTEP